PLNSTLWTPPLSPKDQQRLNQQRLNRQRAYQQHLNQLRLGKQRTKQQPIKHQRQRQLRQKRSWLSILGFSNRSLREHLEFFAVLALPVILAAGTIWYTNVQGQAAVILAQDQQQEAALQAYLDRMSDLLFTDHLEISQPGDEVRQVARARTL